VLEKAPGLVPGVFFLRIRHRPEMLDVSAATFRPDRESR
jgi:hypothetical protein